MISTNQPVGTMVRVMTYNVLSSSLGGPGLVVAYLVHLLQLLKPIYVVITPAVSRSG